MNDRPQLQMLASGNGAGKSTFFRLALEPLGLPLVNADLLAQMAFAEAAETHSYEAAHNPFQPVLTIRNGEITPHRDALPEWTAALPAHRRTER